MKMVRLAVLGSGGVGKTSILGQFMNGVFPDNYKPTIEDSHRHFVQLPDGCTHSIEILDTAGMHQFPAMRQLSIQSSQAFVLVYAIDDVQSFHEALRLADHIHDKKGAENVPIVIVGNKTDLKAYREVNVEEAQLKSAQKKCVHVETSAKSYDDVKKVFMDLLFRLYSVEGKIEPPRKRSLSKIRRLSSGLLRRNSDGDNNNANPECTIM